MGANFLTIKDRSYNEARGKCQKEACGVEFKLEFMFSLIGR